MRGSTSVRRGLVPPVVAAAQTVALGTSAATSTTTLSLSAQTQVPLGASAGLATPTLAVSAQTQVPLASSAALATPTLAVTAQTVVVLGQAVATGSTTLQLSAATTVALDSCGATASATAGITFLLTLVFEDTFSSASVAYDRVSGAIDPLVIGGGVLDAADSSYPNDNEALPFFPYGSVDTAAFVAVAKLRLNYRVDPAAQVFAYLFLGVAVLDSTQLTASLNGSSDGITRPQVLEAYGGGSNDSKTPLDFGGQVGWLVARCDGTTVTAEWWTDNPYTTGTSPVATETAAVDHTATGPPNRFGMEIGGGDGSYVDYWAVYTGRGALADVPEPGVEVPLDPCSASSTVGDLGLSAGTSPPVDPADAVSSGTLALTAQTQVPLDLSPGVATGSLSVSAQTQVPLNTSAGVASNTLALSAVGGLLPLDPTSATATPTLKLSAATQIPALSSTAQGSSSLSLQAQTRIALAGSTAMSHPTLAVSTPSVAAVVTVTASLVTAATTTVSLVTELNSSATQVTSVTTGSTALTSVATAADERTHVTVGAA